MSSPWGSPLGRLPSVLPRPLLANSWSHYISLSTQAGIQDRHTAQATLLKESQEVIFPEYYRQLAKYSGSVGSWIIPPNPFAEALQNLHSRCEQEIQEA